MRSGRTRTCGLAMVGLLFVFLGHNLWWLVRDQRRLPCEERLCRWPRDLEEVARRSTHAAVRGRLAVFYHFAQRIPGAALTVPEWMADHRWDLEHAARLRVTVSAAPLVVDAGQVAALTRAATAHLQWLRRGGSERRRRFQPIHLRLGGAAEYVLCETPQTFGPLFVVPRSEYERLAHP